MGVYRIFVAVVISYRVLFVTCFCQNMSLPSRCPPLHPHNATVTVSFDSSYNVVSNNHPGRYGFLECSCDASNNVLAKLGCYTELFYRPKMKLYNGQTFVSELGPHIRTPPYLMVCAANKDGSHPKMDITRLSKVRKACLDDHHSIQEPDTGIRFVFTMNRAGSPDTDKMVMQCVSDEKFGVKAKPIGCLPSCGEYVSSEDLQTLQLNETLRESCSHGESIGFRKCSVGKDLAIAKYDKCCFSLDYSFTGSLNVSVPFRSGCILRDTVTSVKKAIISCHAGNVFTQQEFIGAWGDIMWGHVAPYSDDSFTKVTVMLRNVYGDLTIDRMCDDCNSEECKQGGITVGTLTDKLVC